MKSSLRLETDFSYGKTNIKDIYFEAPYKIMSPFVQGDCTEVMQMCASAGMLSFSTADGEQKSRWIQMIRDKKPDQVEAGCSECRQGILLRVLGKSSDAVYDYFEDIAREV